MLFLVIGVVLDHTQLCSHDCVYECASTKGTGTPLWHPPLPISEQGGVGRWELAETVDIHVLNIIAHHADHIQLGVVLVTRVDVVPDHIAV